MEIKTRHIHTELLLETWLATVSTLLFPSFLEDELRPFDLLNEWGDTLRGKREAYRVEVDLLIDRLLEIDIPENYWQVLREVDPTISALFFDRIQEATYGLETIKKAASVTEIPESPQTLIAFLLLQKLFQ